MLDNFEFESNGLKLLRTVFIETKMILDWLSGEEGEGVWPGWISDHKTAQ